MCQRFDFQIKDHIEERDDDLSFLCSYCCERLDNLPRLNEIMSINNPKHQRIAAVHVGPHCYSCHHKRKCEKRKEKKRKEKKGKNE